MRQFLFLLLLPMFLHGPASAQQASDTTELVLELYREAGPGVGCLLLEPEMVLFFGGHKPRTHRITEAVSSEDAGTFERLNRFLQSRGHRLVLEDDSFFGQSLVGLEQCTARSGLDWVEPFSKETGWRGYDRWVAEAQRKLDEDTLDLVDFMYGRPDSALMGSDDDAVAESFFMTTSIPYAYFLSGYDVDFRVSPNDAAAPDVVEATRRLGSELSRFYTDPKVRELLQSEEFLKARRERRPRLKHDAQSEAWLRGEPNLWSTFNVSAHPGLTVEHERVLLSNVDELVQRLQNGETPQELAIWLYTEGAEEGTPPLEASQIKTWVWTGGYGKHPAREKVYNAFKEQSPVYISKLAEYYLDSWLEDGGSSGESTFVLLSHPDIKARFTELSVEQQSKAREILSRSESLLVRALSQEPPYAP